MLASKKSAVDHELPTHYTRPTLTPSLIWSARVFIAGMLAMWGAMQVATSRSAKTMVSWNPEVNALRPCVDLSFPVSQASKGPPGSKNWPQPPLGAPIEWYKCPDSPDTYW
jgi:hypothetical protein